MDPFRRLLALGLMLVVVGCGARRPDVPAAQTPLTLEQWKALSAQSKYEIETLERLKQGTPRLREQREWDRFTRDVLLPAKRKEMSNGRLRP